MLGHSHAIVIINRLEDPHQDFIFSFPVSPGAQTQIISLEQQALSPEKAFHLHIHLKFGGKVSH